MPANAASEPKRIRLVLPNGLNASALKTIAIIAMVVDHVAYVFLPNYYSPLGILMHFIGRITGPVMFYLMAEGYHKTHDANRYTLRLALFAVISYIPFIYMDTGGLPTAENALDFNVIYTLLCAFLALRAIHELKTPWRWALVAALVVVAELGDWGYVCVLMVLAFDTFRGHFRYQAAGYSLIVALQILPQLARVLTHLTAGGAFADVRNLLGYCIVQTGMFVPLVLLALYNGKRGNMNKWVFYVFYPAHMLVIGGLHQLVVMYTAGGL